MLFNSFVFLFVFLPVTVAGFALVRRFCPQSWVSVWLLGASLVFYAWWNPVNLWLLGLSMLVNLWLGRYLASQEKGPPHRRPWLVVGIVFNLGLLGVFKYADFAVRTVNTLAHTQITLPGFTLPLAISFFTFIQIAWLVDAWKGRAEKYGVLEYCLFVTFFPHLIAGPIIHHHELIPQFRLPYRFTWENMTIGGTLLLFGLFKKVVLADTLAPYATTVFKAAQAGTPLSFLEAWAGALAYTLQIYFDFSGYSDMALGSARMLGIWLPVNFNSPYQATSIIDFWRRWHMTLSRFLRDYLYIPLGGNRLGESRRFVNLFLTMLLGGLWHGAGWTFVAWGALHGFYLILNHAWREWATKPAWIGQGQAGVWAGRLLTFLAVVVAWVFFRAESFAAAKNILGAMAGITPATGFNQVEGTWPGAENLGWLLLVLLPIVWFFPNTQVLLSRFQPALQWKAATGQKVCAGFAPSLGWAVVSAAMLISCLLHLSRITSEFLYFQF